ncbi:hypothetical protein E2C01_083663 [Portunus trituberculatus]|uniref:Uncharacterized protein n=1 Tax=Portunus trituberculatus TaxID=210409 RepID=A0A5B7J8M3_PORTR|nr:hypothetical protein [Portunus trituberculatus]
MKKEKYRDRETNKTVTMKPFSTGTHFYLGICVRLDHFIDIRKSLWRSED